MLCVFQVLNRLEPLLSVKTELMTIDENRRFLSKNFESNWITLNNII